MTRARLALYIAGSLIIALQAPLWAQDDSDSSTSETSEDDFVDIDIFTGDDAIDVDADDDGKAEELEFVEDDWDVAFDDADEFGEDVGDGVDADDPQLFQDRLPALRLEGDGDDEADGGEGDGMAFHRPGAFSFGGIAGGTQVRRQPHALQVKDGQASFQAQIRYQQNPLSWASERESASLSSMAGWELRHVCGGALIAPNWVITAAHCATERHFLRGLEVVLGADDISSETGAVFKVDRVVLHRDYKDNNMYRNDIAMLHLEPKAGLNKFTPITPYTGPAPRAGTGISTLGWGKTLASNVSSVLFRADIKLIDPIDCASRPDYGRHFEPKLGREIEPIDGSVICGGDTASKACKGDSGGPVVMTNGKPMLVGIVSWTKRDSCGRPEYPGVYTRIGAFSQWITKAMAPALSGRRVVYLGS